MKKSMMTMNKSIILLSGGLDSVISLACAKEEYNISLALTFNYGQRAKNQEIAAAANIAKYYNIEYKVIDIPWLAEITSTSLVNISEKLPALKINELDTIDLTEESAKKVWVPNRNGVFINIAASFADSYNYTHIIFGANSEEATTFPDNSQEFISRINESLQYSTMVKPELVAPLINYNKKEIVKIGIEKKIPFNLIRSCYTDNQKHCGECESCLRLKRALTEIADKETCKLVFGD